MSCQAWQELLQRHLDGGGSVADLQRHAVGCPDCAAHWPAIQRLLAGMGLLRPPAPSVGLRERVTASLISQRQRSHRRVFVLTGLAAAAAVLAIVSWAWWPARDLGHGPIARVEAPAEPLRESFEQAGNAVAALTSRTASETMERTTIVLPLMKQSAEPFAEVPAALEPPLEPFREATQGVSAGLAPVADSARRAVGLFLRDLPMGSTP